MKRRDFITTLSASTLAILAQREQLLATIKPSLVHSPNPAEPPQIAITLDDFALEEVSLAKATQRNQAVIATLRKHNNLQAAGFICGRRVDNEIGKSVLKEWDQAGHIIANHTYSHWYYHKHSVEEFSADILRCEALIKDYKNFRKYFRFPLLKEGNTIERRDQMRAFLKKQGYRQGYVTIDASDWYIDERLRARQAQNPQADLHGYQKYYLDHIWDRATYYDNLALKVLGRRVKHTLLIHHNLLNSLFLDDLLTMFEQKGWKLINAETAFSDPIFSAEPAILPAGESIIWALAKESGKFDSELRYPGEDSDYEQANMDRLGL